MPANTSKTPRIVVGVDGSPSSVTALRWAIKQADLNGSAVEAITAWQIPAAMTGYGWAPVPVADCSDMELIAKRALEEAITEAAGANGGPMVHGEIGRTLRSGNRSDNFDRHWHLRMPSFRARFSDGENGGPVAGGDFQRGR